MQQIAGFSGAVLGPADEGYEEARRIWNGAIDRRPALIARCCGAGDVVVAVRHARDHDLLAAVRGGGHQVSGHSLCDDGLVIDCSTMKGIEVDPARRSARSQPGVLWDDLAEGERLLAPLRRYGDPLVDLIARKPYLEHQAMLDPAVPHGLHATTTSSPRPTWRRHLEGGAPNRRIKRVVPLPSS